MKLPDDAEHSSMYEYVPGGTLNVHDPPIAMGPFTDQFVSTRAYAGVPPVASSDGVLVDPGALAFVPRPNHCARPV
jgi:hypothetical protein